MSLALDRMRSISPSGTTTQAIGDVVDRHYRAVEVAGVALAALGVYGVYRGHTALGIGGTIAGLGVVSFAAAVHGASELGSGVGSMAGNAIGQGIAGP